MFKSFALCLLIATVCFAALGCAASPESQLEGKWKFDSVDLGAAASNPMAAAAVSQLKNLNPTIEFKGDKHFVSVGYPVAEGNWSIKDGIVTLTKTSIGGQNIADVKKQAEKMSQNPQFAQLFDKMYGPETATLSEDGKTLKLKDSSIGNFTYSKNN